MKILDCTLRDGGYYNSWDFDAPLVQAYLQAVAAAGIDYVELGFRDLAQPGFYGPYAYTTESFLSRLVLPPGPQYGVMINAATVLKSKLDSDEVLDKLFVDASQSKLELVRIAAHLDEIERCQPITQHLKDKGYIVGINLMQIGGRKSSYIQDLGATIAAWGTIDVLYFADSFGNMDVAEVTRTVSALRETWQGELGIHTHNNMGLALQNSMAAYKLNVEWLDATVSGMGRGAGNTPTETLLASLASLSDKYRASSIYELSIRYFQPMKKDYGWGDNLLYFLGAQNDVHPLYIQNLLSGAYSGVDEVIGAIDYLSQLEGASKYDGATMQTALTLTDTNSEPEGSPAIRGLFAGREVLLVGSGPLVEKHLSEIYAYIEDRKPVVVIINVHETFDPKFVDYYCFVRNSKFLAESRKYHDITKPIILPMHRFAPEELDLLPEKTTRLAYGMKVSSGEFVIEDAFCILPYEVTVGYALAVAKTGSAERISMVGFDGYDPGDLRQKEMVDLLALVANAWAGFELRALTPTSYPIKLGSVYAPAG